MWFDVAATVAIAVVILALAACVPATVDKAEHSLAERVQGVVLIVVLIVCLAFGVVAIWT